jgi:hypothetical protein
MNASTLSSERMLSSRVVMTETACSASSSLLACSSLVVNLWNFVNKFSSSLCSSNNLSQTAAATNRIISSFPIPAIPNNFCLFCLCKSSQVPSERQFPEDSQSAPDGLYNTRQIQFSYIPSDVIYTCI